MKDRKRYNWSITKDREKDRYYFSRRIDYRIGNYRYSRSLWISAGIEKDIVLRMQSDGLGEIEIFYLFQFPSSFLFQSFYFQQGANSSNKNCRSFRRLKKLIGLNSDQQREMVRKQIFRQGEIECNKILPETGIRIGHMV